MTIERDRTTSLFGALASAADLANGFHAEKAVRTAVVAQRLSEAHGGSSAEQSDAYFLALLRFLGCTAFAHEEAHLYGGGEDISVRSVMGFVDPDQPMGLVRDIVRGVGKGAPLLSRAKGVATLLSRPSAAQGHAEAQCDVAVALASTLEMPDHLRGALADLFERWDGKGHPNGKAGEAVPLLARIVAAADVLEIDHTRLGPAGSVTTALRHRRSDRSSQCSPMRPAPSSLNGSVTTDTQGHWTRSPKPIRALRSSSPAQTIRAA